MELLIVILLLIIGLLTFLVLKKERVLGIKPETTNKNTEVNFYTGMFDFSDDGKRSSLFGVQHPVSYTHLTLPTKA